MKLVGAGMGPSQVAKEVGISRASVHRIIQQSQPSASAQRQPSDTSKFVWEEGDLKAVGKG